MNIKVFIIISIIFFPFIMNGQSKYGNVWTLGYSSDSADITGCVLDFNYTPVKISPLKNNLLMEGSVATVCDSNGNFQFYSNGCEIAGSDNEILENGDSIGLGLLELSFCVTGGNPQTQGILALPLPNHDSLYYLFYTNIETPYSGSEMHFFPLAPTALYYSVIDMTKNQGKGKVVLKNQIIISDTLSRVMMQATKIKHKNGWWLVVPESHSNCYYIIGLSSNGIDSVSYQCIGNLWGDEDLNGQVAFSPDGLKYARFNSDYGLNIFNFDNDIGRFLDFESFPVDSDSFNYCGVAFSPNSRFIYTTTQDKLFQFDLNSPNVFGSRILIDELNTPSDIQFKTLLNQALLAPDGKIYIGGANTHNYLHIINAPNCIGQLCNFKQYAMKLPCFNKYGLPNLPIFNNWMASDTCDSVNTKYLINTSKIEIYPNPFVDEITVNCEAGIDFTLFNVLGIKIFSARIQAPISKFSLNGFISNGIYYYQFNNQRNIVKSGTMIKIN